tara:strand:+ start:161 stop:778 length:618 start_codon:yes stop_codon:yes gene_type:complete
MKPHMSIKELKEFSSRIIKSKEYFEYGLGGSTLYAFDFSDAKISGVDTSKEWIKDVSTEIEKSLMYDLINDKTRKINNDIRADLRHIDLGPVGKWGRVKNWKKDDQQKFYKYSKSIFDFETNPDLIFIDGRWRVACAAQAVLFSLDKNISPIIMLHDAERKQYAPVWDILEPIKRVDRLQLFKLKKENDISQIEKIYEEHLREDD